ncbi:MAG: PEGA domain-containing protein [Dehalococcoidia bacterium]|nr:PEGA domain-containing protein [Dehalococcoidia bacterium]
MRYKMILLVIWAIGALSAFGQNPNTDNIMLSRGIKAYEELEWANGILFLTEAVKLDLSDAYRVQAYQYLGFCQIEAGLLEQAKSSFRSLLQIAPAHLLGDEFPPKYRQVFDEVKDKVVRPKRIVVVTSSPTGANVYFDGVLQPEKTPTRIEKVDHNAHTLKLVLEGYEQWEEEVPAEGKGFRALRKLEFSPVLVKIEVKTGSIFVKSDPAGANILLDKQSQNQQTPTVISEISVGPHQIKLFMNGYVDWEQQISVEADKISQIEAKLSPKLPDRPTPKPKEEPTPVVKKTGGKLKWILIGGVILAAGSGGAYAYFSQSGSDTGARPAGTGSLTLTVSY